MTNNDALKISLIPFIVRSWGQRCSMASDRKLVIGSLWSRAHSRAEEKSRPFV